MNEHFDEKALIVALFSDKSAFSDAFTAGITAADFQDDRNALLFSAIAELFSSNQNINIANILTLLESKKQVDEAGGKEYIAELLDNNTLYSSDVHDLINSIKDKSLLTTFTQKLTAIVNETQSSPISNVTEYLEKCEDEILKLTHKRRNSPVMNMEAVSTSIVNRLMYLTNKFEKEGKKPDGVIGLESGYEYLDGYTQGWCEQNLIIIGARPSVGKTSFLLQLLLNVAKRGTPVLLFSLEMNEVAIGEKLLANLSKLPSKVLHSLSVKANSRYDHIISDSSSIAERQQISDLQAGLIELSHLPIFIDPNPGTNILDIIAKAKKIYNQSGGKIGMIGIDYLQLIQDPSRAGKSTSDQLDAITNSLKQLARDLNIPVIVLSQLSRDSEKDKNKNSSREVQMSDLRGSGGIEQTADLVFFLERADYQKTSEDSKDDSPVSDVVVSLKKNRTGALHNFKFAFNKETNSFNAIIPDQQF